jgi:hypothetical protein
VVVLHTDTHTCTHAHIHTHTHTWPRTHAHTNTHTHTHTHIYTHARAHALACRLVQCKVRAARLGCRCAAESDGSRTRGGQVLPAALLPQCGRHQRGASPHPAGLCARWEDHCPCGDQHHGLQLHRFVMSQGSVIKS